MSWQTEEHFTFLDVTFQKHKIPGFPMEGKQKFKNFYLKLF